MVESCVICLGESGQALAGKRCRASACKKAYAERLASLKAARTGQLATPASRGASPAPSTAGTTSTDSAPDSNSLSQFKLWELLAVYGRRDYDPEQLSPYELRNGVSAGIARRPCPHPRIGRPRPRPRLVLTLAWDVSPLPSPLALASPMFS
jgi:hypothetical protein